MTMVEMNLPEELITDILSRLPVKHLLPLRCVSKRWLQLLTTDPQFAKLHLDRSIGSNNINPNPSVLACGDYVSQLGSKLYLAIDYAACDTVIPLEFPFDQDTFSRYYVVGICNGLLCLYCDNEGKVYICNPLTKDYITIPFPPSPRYFSSATRGFGFGFGKGSNECKVIAITVFKKWVHNVMEYHSQVSVYTLGVDSAWRTLEEDFQCDLNPRPIGIPLVNGVLHWLSYDDHIIALDLDGEFFSEILPPCGINLDEPSTMKRIVELGGLLCIMTAKDVWGLEVNLQIWAMKEYGVVNSWTKQITIRIPGPRNPFNIFAAFSLAQNGKILLTKNLQELFLYDPETNAVTNLKRFQFKPVNVYPFIGSILSPRVIGRAGHISTQEET